MAEKRSRRLSVLLCILIGLIGIGYECYSNRNAFYKMAVQYGFNSFEHSVLCFILSAENNGTDNTPKTQKFGVNAHNDSKCSATLIIHDEDKFYSTIAISGAKVGFGEAYFKGYWSTETYEELETVVYHSFYNKLHKYSRAYMWIFQYVFSFKHLYWWIYRHTYFMDKNVDEDRKSIEAHYDVGNDFYQLFLNEKLKGYSCGIFNHKNDTLDESQDNKWDIVMKKANIYNVSNEIPLHFTFEHVK